MQKPFNAALARSRNDHLGAAVIDGMKIVFARQPHAGQSGEVINLIDAVERSIHHVLVKHRAADILHLGQRAGRRLQIKHAHGAATLGQCRDQMLSDETAAASDEYPCHACGRGSAWRFSA